MNFAPNILVSVAVVFWVASVGCCALAWYWSRENRGRHFGPSLVLVGISLLIGYFGLRNVKLEYSKTVNGQLTQHLKSQWFFEMTLVIALVALGFVIYKEVQFRKRAEGHGDADHQIQPGSAA
ncbi:MAG: hypothetical protein JWN25_1368 [Verrucomicrobiales bacterium]|nr:hypothetical protein [Verrucomicrobiales bacterium]